MVFKMMFITRDRNGRLKQIPEKLNRYLNAYPDFCIACEYSGRDEQTYAYYGCPECQCREIGLIEELRSCWVDDKKSNP